MHRARRLLVTATLCLVAMTAAAAEDPELAKLREEIKELRRSYDDRMQALEKRLQEAEARAGEAQQTATQADQAAQALSSRENVFNPAISLILQGTWARTQQDPKNFVINGFVPSGGEVGPPRRSFGLGESELFLTANVDPYFRGTLIASLAPDNTLDVEEAFFNTLALPRGLTLKGGRFLSGIGYLNEIHQHAWDFQDAPLAYQAFLGGRFQQDGVQMRWLPPTPFLTELGAEVGSGRAFPSNDQNKNGATSYALTAHVGDDIGESYAWRAGVSYLHTAAANRAYNDVDALGGATTNRFTGRTNVWIADAVLKWAPNGNSTATNFKLQGEYFRRRENGSLAYDDTAGSAVFGTLSGTYRSAQSGWYAQGVYQFMPRWRVGYRYDQLYSGTPEIGILANGLGPTLGDFPTLAPYNPKRNTAMIDWSLTEFSRFRVQVAQDKSRIGATDTQILLQYIQSLGPHGAHKF